MNANEFTATISTSFSILDIVVTKLKNISQDSVFVFERNEHINQLEKLRSNISLVNKFNPFSYPDYYTTDERDNISILIISIENYLSAIESSLLDEVAHKAIKNINNELVKFVRISILIQEASNRNNSAKAQNKRIQEQMSSIVEMKNEISIDISNAQSMIEQNASTNEKIIKLVNDLKSENNIASKNGSDINSILTHSVTALKRIDSVSKNLDEADEKLSEMLKRNEISENKLLTLISNSEAKIGNVINKSDEIENLGQTITTQVSKAQELVSDARAALNLAGTYRLSRHFKNAYELANKNRMFWAWVSLFSALTCIGFVIYILVEMNIAHDKEGPHLLMLFIARFSIIPILIGFFAFSAVQYVKQNNITEDYAHKKLLSETLISFKQEIDKNNTDKSSIFMDNILNAVLTPPTNANDKKSHKLEIDKINSLINTTAQINKEIIDKVIPFSEKETKKEEHK